MPSLTSLPLSLQSRILTHLYDEEVFNRRAQLHRTFDYIPFRHPKAQISLDGVQTVNAPLPGALLAPALASPVLAAAAERVVQGRLSYLTDMNTEGHLACWVNAFSRHVKAISVIDAGEKWRNDLQPDSRRKMEEMLGAEAVDLFREISTNEVKLNVLDVVNVPFDKCDDLQDDMISGLFATLESCQSTMKELALPVYPESDLCSDVLATVTLPHLTVLSIELKDTRELKRVSSEEIEKVGGQFLGMMQAVDGHADRLNGLTTLEELRLINLYGVPCDTADESGCSDGFFRAIKTLRVDMNHSRTEECSYLYESVFCSLFTELENLYRSGTQCIWFSRYMYLCERLKEVHICLRNSRTGARANWQWHESVFMPKAFFAVLDALRFTQQKIRTLVTYAALSPQNVLQIAKDCPNLQSLSLCITDENLHALRALLLECSELTVLELMIAEDFSRMGRDRWTEVARMISHQANLRELDIRTQRRSRKAVPVDIATDCLVTILKGIGRNLEVLMFRVYAKRNTSARVLDALCRIMDCCTDYSPVLTHLEIEIEAWHRSKRPEETSELRDARGRLRLCKEKLVKSQVHLNKVELGEWHYLLYE